MIENLKAESPAWLRHEYGTPVNHIIGYSELLIEDAGDRRLEPLIPVFRRISEGGRDLLKTIQTAFSENQDLRKDSERGNFRANLHAAALEMSGTLESVLAGLQSDHRQTLADLTAISWAVNRLFELAGQEETRVLDPKHFKAPTAVEFQSFDVSAVPANRGGGRIVVADDDAAGRNLLRRRLECEGHEVIEARNGLEVLESLRRSSCDLVLLDIVMPVMDGFEALARMKQDVRLRELPVIMISALDELSSVVRCIEMGADDYLPKPFNRVLLRARIGASLEKKWLRDSERLKSAELEQTLQLLQRAQEQLSLQASRDTLTGLLNRRSMETNLNFRVERGTIFTVLYIDLNGFKKINDLHGHATGDDLLKQVGNRLRKSFRLTDVIGRWGGDEFVALVDAGADEIQTNIQRINACWERDFVIDKSGAQHRIDIAASVGIATWRPGETATEVLHRADFAMYEEKLRISG